MRVTKATNTDGFVLDASVAMNWAFLDENDAAAGDGLAATRR